MTMNNECKVKFNFIDICSSVFYNFSFKDDVINVMFIHLHHPAGNGFL